MSVAQSSSDCSYTWGSQTLLKRRAGGLPHHFLLGVTAENVHALKFRPAQVFELLKH